MRGLYAIIDTEALARRGVPPVAFAERVLAAGPAAIQLRDKRGGARATLALLRELAPLAAAAGVPLFANDRPDLARLAGCDGVHVGQDDLPVALVREAFPGLRVGLSTHDAAQVEQAITEAPDYLAVGPIFATASKENPSPVVGIAGLRELAARASGPARAADRGHRRHLARDRGRGGIHGRRRRGDRRAAARSRALCRGGAPRASRR